MSEEDDFQLSREARARTMGYSDQRFYRGEASGATPNEYQGAFFSRDKEYATGFAKQGGAEHPREFRLNLNNTYQDHGPLTAERFGRLIQAANERGDHKLAADLAESVAPGRGVKWVLGFAQARPDAVVADSGGAAFIRQAIERGAGDHIGLFKVAGYDAIDSGRDVRKLSGEGIRLTNAEFSPTRAASRNIRAGWLMPLAMGGVAYDAASSRAEAAGMTQTQARNEGLTAGGVTAGGAGAIGYGLSKLPVALSRAIGVGGQMMAPQMAADAYDPTPEQLAMDRNRAARYLPEWARAGGVEDAYQMAQVPERSPRRPDIPR